MKTKAWMTGAAACGALLACGAANAVIVLGNGDSVNLGALFAAGSDRKVQIDDKLFTFESVRSSSFTVSDFAVVGFISASTNQWGLRNVGFDLTGPFGDGTPGNGQMSEMNLQYTVEVMPEAYDRDIRLCDTGLTFNGSSGGIGSFARVDETVWDLDRNQFLGNLSTFWNAGPPPTYRLSDHADWCELTGEHGFRALEVNKDLKFFANGAGGFSTASFVRQEFSQIMAPAPGAIALLAAGGILGARRRRGDA
jgi:hypothetical protein